VWLALAVLTWCGSVAGEALADRQLARFRADPNHRGRTCRAGLWRYSRHPNYFFEALHWVSYPLLAIGAPFAALAWLGPLVMFFFLRFLSGIPFTEAQALRTRGEDYRDYQHRTSMLIPWPPRRG
jgi:steroid 5-alpha reductase family enzyme